MKILKRFKRFRRLALRTAQPAQILVVLRDLGDKLPFRFEEPRRFLFGRLGARLDLGKVAATFGDDVLGPRFGLGVGGVFGLGSRLGNRLVERGLGRLGLAPGLLGVGLDRQPRGLAGFLRFGEGFLALGGTSIRESGLPGVREAGPGRIVL